MKKEQDRILMVCECACTMHQLIFNFDDEDKQIFVHMHLKKISWYKRVWVAIKYVFGHQSKFGEFDEVILGEKHLKKFEEIVEFLKK